jgi:glyoxylase-like metal-dependent hydrolase (beta-lactamase superfamily II)
MVNKMIIKQFREEPLDNNNYVVIDPISKEAVLIDCSCPDDSIMDYIKEQGAVLKFILLTHGHLDHVMGVIHFQKKHNILVYIAKEDMPLMADINSWTQLLGWPEVDVPKADKILPMDEELMLGKNKIQIIPTPGHTAGGVCYLIGDNLFSGDTLFRGTYGRTDLPGSSQEQMNNSLQKLFDLPEATKVFSGHGAPTTIADEKKLYRF